MNVYYVPVLLYLLLVIIMMSSIVILSSLVGKKPLTDVQKIPYECGLDPAGPKEAYVPIKFYIIAMLFIVFDIEVVFFYPWLIVYKGLGVVGFVEMIIFFAILLIGLFYVIKKGALKWE
ncbi:NADH-quinone oxidoreductase subunit A [Desulfothermus okinawensis JCM 13304]